MYTGVFSISDLLGIAVGIGFFMVIKYTFSKQKSTWSNKLREYIILVMIIWVLKSLVKKFF